MEADRFGNVVEDLAMKFAAVGPSEQNGLQVSIAVSHEQARRYPTAYAPNCTIAMHLAATRVHDTEMAFVSTISPVSETEPSTTCSVSAIGAVSVWSKRPRSSGCLGVQ